jgi:predicted transcriptional regulator
VSSESYVLKHVVKPCVVILEAIVVCGGRARASDIIKRLSGWSLASIYTGLRNAMLEGLVAKDGKHYVITEKGREFLRQSAEVLKQLIEVVEKML